VVAAAGRRIFGQANSSTSGLGKISQLRIISMNYSKPEVKTLGHAKSVIERNYKVPPINVFDPYRILTMTPAYDLDE
jgi:hypothetical protein